MHSKCLYKFDVYKNETVNEMSRESEDKHTCPLYIAFCSGLGRQHTKGADGSRYQSIFYEPT